MPSVPTLLDDYDRRHGLKARRSVAATIAAVIHILLGWFWLSIGDVQADLRRWAAKPETPRAITVIMIPLLNLAEGDGAKAVGPAPTATEPEAQDAAALPIPADIAPRAPETAELLGGAARQPLDEPGGEAVQSLPEGIPNVLPTGEPFRCVSGAIYAMTLRLFVLPDGRVRTAMIARSSGFRGLDEIGRADAPNWVLPPDPLTGAVAPGMREVVLPFCVQGEAIPQRQAARRR
jgi:hypothetical protein